MILKTVAVTTAGVRRVSNGIHWLSASSMPSIGPLSTWKISLNQSNPRRQTVSSHFTNEET